MSPPPSLCSLSVRMAVKCGICGVLDAEVSFDSWVCAHEMLEFIHGAPYAVCVELKNFYLFVFCFGGLLFVSCVTVCGCGCGDVKSWDGCCCGASYGCLCNGTMWGESGRVGCIRSRV